MQLIAFIVVLLLVYRRPRSTSTVPENVRTFFGDAERP
jgi:hypothetical protein